MKTGDLIQVSIAILPEAEEVVSTLLENLFGQPPSIYTAEETKATSATIFIQENQWKNSLRQKIADGLKGIEKDGFKIGSGKISVRKLRRKDWTESWKRHFKPIEIGNALLIKPSWSKRHPKKNQAIVILDPGLSFGTGQHATTSFCLEQIVVCRRADERQSFLDIGTGSGILAIAASKVGYAPVQAFDFDPESVRVSRENAKQNGVEKSVRPIQRDLTTLPLESKTRFDLICANLIYDLLIAETERVLNRLKPSGHLVLAGILGEQFGKVKKRYESFGLKLVATKSEKEWQSGRFIFHT